MGILVSRLFGLARQRVIAHVFGQSTEVADAFYAAFRIPNFLQNLFGEGVLSASMIPEYTRLLAAGRTSDARRLVGAVAGLLGVLVTTLVALGVQFAPVLVDVIVPGFEGAKRLLAIQLVRILFPGVGALVLSAWCLAVLNSHRKFLLSYMAPVVWNVAIIVATLIPSHHMPVQALVQWTAWGAVVGSVLQFLIQLPSVWRLTGGFPLSFDTGDARVRAVIANFGPVFVGRGVVQLSAFIDAMIASLLPTGAVAVISNAQTLYLLPVSLFGMSVAAAELPEMSVEAGGGEARGERLAARISAGSERIAYFVVPSAMAFLSLGHVLAALLLQSGRFSQQDAYWVWGTLAGSAVGLVASSMGRLLTSTYYAMGDMRRPLGISLIRVATTLVLGYVAAVHGPRLLHLDARWGTVGLTATAGLAGWLEFALLRRGLLPRIGHFGLPGGLMPRLWLAAVVASGIAWLMQAQVAGAEHGALARGLLAAGVLALYGATYLVMTLVLRIPQARDLLARLRPPR